jgi:GntR family transcriptional repressor for pyruvate dehydrogenase complex
VFKPFGGVRKAEHVVQQVLETIQAGGLNPGDKLPEENAMAAQFEVSRNCIREALRILETMGAVAVRHGRGCFVMSAADPAEPPKILLSWLKAFESEVLDLLEVREAMEAKAARLAAGRATPEDLAELERLADEMADGVKAGTFDSEALARLDRAFHTSLARASHNTFLLKLGPGTWAAADRRAVFAMEGRDLLSARQHQEISAAIAARDPAAAETAVSRHIRDVIDQVRALSPKAGAGRDNEGRKAAAGSASDAEPKTT